MYSLPWAEADLSAFDLSNSDRAKIDAGHPVPCRLCEAVYRVLTLTMRYCATCEQGYCQQAHGGWVGRRGACVQCGPHQARRPPQPDSLDAVGVGLAEGVGKVTTAVDPPLQTMQTLSFDVFWPRLKEELAQFPGPQPGVHLLTVRKWSQHSGEMPGSFTLVYRGGDTFECDTASTEGVRTVSSAEVRKVYEVWSDYRAGRRGRSFITNDLGVQNTTWIIPLLRRFEGLMV